MAHAVSARRDGVSVFVCKDSPADTAWNSKPGGQANMKEKEMEAAVWQKKSEEDNAVCVFC